MEVTCPRCRKKVEFSPANPYRPFCSERCSILDLGAWADEQYRVPVEEAVNENSGEESDAPEEFPPKKDLN